MYLFKLKHQRWYYLDNCMTYAWPDGFYEFQRYIDETTFVHMYTSLNNPNASFRNRKTLDEVVDMGELTFHKRGRFPWCMRYDDVVKDGFERREFRLSDPLWTFFGWRQQIDLTDEYKQELYNLGVVSFHDPPPAMYDSFKVRRLPQMAGEANADRDWTIHYTLSLADRRKFLVVGYFDVTLGVRPWPCTDTHPVRYKPKSVPLEMSFAPACRNFDEFPMHDVRKEMAEDFSRFWLDEYELFHCLPVTTFDYATHYELTDPSTPL